MRVLAHLSDLHFGRVDEALLAPIAATLAHLRPHLVVVSGDLTQRARRKQFVAARAFLDRLPHPQIVVPGNHDVPLFDVVTRFVRPLARYRSLISDDVEPRYVDEEIAVVGVNTARSLTIEGGRINGVQVQRIRALLCNVAPGVLRIVVTHHPFDAPAGHDPRKIVGRAAMGIEALASCGIDVCLAGHLHVASPNVIAERPVLAGRRMLLVQAGTATSTRERGEANSFNVIVVDGSSIVVERRVWQPRVRSFELASATRFRREPDGWHPD